MAKYSKCPKCGAKGYYEPRFNFGGDLAPGEQQFMCKYCHTRDVVTREIKHPEKREDVHTTHCCTKHGCKYGASTCSVVNLGWEQIGPCETCRWEEEEAKHTGGGFGGLPTPAPVIDEEALDDYLKKHLSISVGSERDYYSSGMRVSLRLKGEEISSDSINWPGEHGH